MRSFRSNSAAKVEAGLRCGTDLTEGTQVVIDGVFDLKSMLLKEHIESGEGG